MFLAGTETSSNTTEWAMTELLVNPDMFSRVRKEVATIVGEDGQIQEAKILDLPYLQAVIKETMRLHLSVPLLEKKFMLNKMCLKELVSSNQIIYVLQI